MIIKKEANGKGKKEIREGGKGKRKGKARQGKEKGSTVQEGQQSEDLLPSSCRLF